MIELLFCLSPFNCRTLNQNSSWLAQWSWTFVNSGFDKLLFGFLIGLVQLCPLDFASTQFDDAFLSTTSGSPLTVYLNFACSLTNKSSQTKNMAVIDNSLDHIKYL